MTTAPQPSTTDVRTAAKHALKLLSSGNFDLAGEQAREVLRQHPREINCQFVLAAVARQQGDHSAALDRLGAITGRAPDFPAAWQELGFTHADIGDSNAALAALHTAVKLDPNLGPSWKLIGELLLADGEEEAAAEAFNRVFASGGKSPELVQIAEELKAGRLARAERQCRDFLKKHPTNVNAIRLLAEIGIKLGVYDEAEKLLERCLELAPDFSTARLNYASALSHRNKLTQALAQVDLLLEAGPVRPSLLTLKASILVKMADFDRALPLYEQLLEDYPPRAKIAMAQGHALKTVGAQEQAIVSYRLASDLEPGFGDAWWSLANLKTFQFTEQDLGVMRREMLAEGNSLEDRFHLSFALGKALETRKEFEESFKFYHLGNQAKMRLEHYSADEQHENTQRMIHTCDRQLVNAPPDSGCQSADPIFIVGLPRSGSTLLEQIIASHSKVDGTKELPDIMALARRLGGKRKRSERSRYPEIMRDLTDDQYRELGEEYLERTRIQRGDAPYFIDKMPNNFFHVGLISRILPNATIIDARRHPMAACFSGFTQLFAKGQPFTYGLTNIGRYYRDYVALMDHWDAVLPGKVLCVQYEEVVADTETQVQRILDHCGLPFEDACLHFHQTQRPVRTASSEQVRQPIYSSGLEHWRNYEPWLDELKSTLGPLLTRYPID